MNAQRQKQFKDLRAALALALEVVGTLKDIEDLVNLLRTRLELPTVNFEIPRMDLLSALRINLLMVLSARNIQFDTEITDAQVMEEIKRLLNQSA